MAGSIIPALTTYLQDAFTKALAANVEVTPRVAEMADADFQINDALRLGARHPGGV